MILAFQLREQWDVATLNTDPSRVLEARMACKVILTNQLIYTQVAEATGVPWLVVACIHYRESHQNFRCHLHNGDPLTNRTIHVPSGRPFHGDPPFTWIESATDALQGREHPFEWGIGDVLEFCERYNGLGYRERQIASPYVWGGTDRYTSGLFIADGTLDMTRKDPRPGVAALLKTLMGMGVPLDFSVKAPQNNSPVH